MIPPILNHFLTRLGEGNLTEQEILQARYEARLHMNFVYVRTTDQQTSSRKYLDIDDDLQDIEDACTTILFCTTRSRRREQEKENECNLD
jgi:hypothetical protein